jgi:predicted DsbA family dithiol-disulfide isomerase
MARQFGARIEWLPFDLHPEYPPEGIPRSQLLARYGEAATANVRRMVEECGYTYNPPPEVVPNSMKALEVTELARDLGIHETVHDRLMHAYWSEAENIGDDETLLGLAAEAGVDRSEAVEALADGRFRSRIASATQDAHSLGINAIPSFVLDNRLLLVGAYPHEVFERAFAQLAETDDESE